MSEKTTLDIIRNSAQKKPVEVRQAVDHLIVQKVAAALAGLRDEVGKEVFNSPKEA